MCSRNPTYCGHNLCCCASSNCYNVLRNYFLPAFKPEKEMNCDVYRQKWIVSNNRSKRLNRSSYPTSNQLYKRTDCTACVSLVDEQGVEMTCSQEDIQNVCDGMNLLVGGTVTCSANGDCCCQGRDCSESLRNFYSGRQRALGPPRMFAALSTGYCHSVNLLLATISIFVIVLLNACFHS